MPAGSTSAATVIRTFLRRRISVLLVGHDCGPTVRSGGSRLLDIRLLLGKQRRDVVQRYTALVGTALRRRQLRSPLGPSGTGRSLIRCYWRQRSPRNGRGSQAKGRHPGSHPHIWRIASPWSRTLGPWALPHSSGWE